MLIPMGILAASGAGAAGAYELISTAYGTGSSGTISFSGIPSTYKHLQIRAAARCATTGLEFDHIYLSFNSDNTVSNYYSHRLEGTGSSVISGFRSSVAGVLAGVSSTNLVASNIAGGSVIDILDYASTTKNKTTRTLGGNAVGSTWRLGLHSGLWMNTAAINSITIKNETGTNWTSLSRFSLYGIKG